MYERTMNSLNKHSILYDSQNGVRQNHATCVAFLETMDRVSDILDRNSTAVGTFIDLFNAFNNVNHNNLLNELYHYEMRGLVV